MRKINPIFFIVMALLIFLVFLFRNFLLELYVGIAQQSIINKVERNDFLLTNCKDSETADKQNEQYTKGIISYTNRNGKSIVAHDRCLPGSNSILIEVYCDPREDGYFVLANEEYRCINGCVDGACQK